MAIGRTVPGESADEAPSEQVAKGMRILLVEDNTINRILVTVMLEKHGHFLIHAANGREALEMIARENFDLIFMDVQMPEMDGFEATRRIREAEQATGRRTPIVAITAYALTGDRARCLAAGMDDYLSKPLLKTDLFELMARVSAEKSAAAVLVPSSFSGEERFDPSPPTQEIAVSHS